MAHCVVPEAEIILDKEYPVLDKGFVRLVDYLGCDERIAIRDGPLCSNPTQRRRNCCLWVDSGGVGCPL